MSEVDDTKDNVDGLLKKRDQLLNEVKTLRAKLAEVTAERDTLAASYGAVTLDKPLSEMLAKVSPFPARFTRPMVEEHFSFSLGDDGEVQMRGKDGKPVQIDGREAIFSESDMRAALAGVAELQGIVYGNQASGGGAPGSTSRAPQSAPKKPEAKPKLASPFGLR